MRQLVFGGSHFVHRATAAGGLKWAFTATIVANDECAFAISRNNGETWNQLSLIDTTIDWFNDVAVSPDCTTIYLASVSQQAGLAPTWL